MGISTLLLVIGVVVGIASAGLVGPLAAGAQTAPAVQAPAAPTPPMASFGERVRALPGWSAILAAFVAFIVGGGTVVLYRAARAGSDPMILRLNPSFFFWLGMVYTASLLVMAIVYNLYVGDSSPALLAGILPVAVPWFGAVGAVAISLEGVFKWNNQWDRAFNYWHIGRPLFGAVLGIVAYFIYVVIVSASGTAPKFLDGGAAQTASKDFIVYYIVAFLVGYREETFRELIRRVTDLILKPGTTTTPGPAVTFKVNAVPQSDLTVPPTAPAGTSRTTVQIENSGNAPLVSPAVAFSPLVSTPANTFALANDQVSGRGDLAPGQTKTVEITFTPTAAGEFSGTLTVTAGNLTTPKTIRVSATAR